jgi:hypothetical protein
MLTDCWKNKKEIELKKARQKGYEGRNKAITYCSVLLHCVDLTFSVIFSVYVQFGMIRSSSHIYHMLRLNWPSSCALVGLTK